MCGIAGFNWSNNCLIKEMADSLKHRGPDQSGYYVDRLVSLGHRRLSIIDLSEKGRQPMQLNYQRNKLVIIFNGEIYNFKELREELCSKGRKFISKTDTEVILHSYAEWGPDCVKRFNGMWAFCIYDPEKEILFLSRDRFGEKPLYYYYNQEQFIFASELKAITKHNLKLTINKKALNHYFYQKYIGNKLTIYNECYKLEPAENLIFHLNNSHIEICKYYSLEEEIDKSKIIPPHQRIGQIKELLIDAVEKRLVSDVPIGSFLSGGLDSSFISAIIARKHKDFDTFSIGFKDQSFNELNYSKFISNYLKTRHHYKYLDIDENLIQKIIKNLDEPFGDSSIIPTYLLSNLTRRTVTVSLSGDAGDELFGGYDTYKGYVISKYFPKFLNGISKKIIKILPPTEKKMSISFKMKKFIDFFNENDIIRRHLNWMATFEEKSRRRLLNNNFVDESKLIGFSHDFCSNRKTGLLSLQLKDIHNYLSEDILKKVDMASMLNSLEVRVPYLDHRLVPLVLSLPESHKIKYLKTKYLLKKIASKYLPNIIIYRKKRGFSVPLSKWVKKSRLLEDYLVKREYYQHNFLNYNYVQKLYGEHLQNREDYSRQLWLVFVFNYWWNNNAK